MSIGTSLPSGSAATTNRKGLKVHAHRDTGSYPLGVKITKAEVASVPLTAHNFHGDWNYNVYLSQPEPQTTTV
jgi:hypothetical protein